MAKLKADIRIVTTPHRRDVCQVELQGIISTPTVARFRELMEEPLSQGRDLLLNLSNITYINSSGLGEMVRMHDVLEQGGHKLLVVNTDAEMARLIRMLGLIDVLNVFDSVDKALAGIDQGLTSNEKEGAIIVPGVEGKVRHKKRGGAFVPVVPTPAPRLPEAGILLCFHGDVHFTRFLARCLTGNGNNAFICQDRSEALSMMEAHKIDIAILDASVPEAHDICQDLKTRNGGGILSVIMVYPSAEEQMVDLPFSVAEDEYVIEPFEVRELIALAQGEFNRCRSESILFVQECCLSISTRDQAISQASDLLEGMLAQSGLPSEVADGFFYAVREAMDNGRRHGHYGDPSKKIEVLYVLDKEKITVTVGDEGEGFDYAARIEAAKSKSPVEQARTRHSSGGYGGLGIGLMLRCCDKVEYLPPGNIVKLTKYL